MMIPGSDTRTAGFTTLKKLIQITVLLWGSAMAVVSSGQTLPGWNLVWADEFTQADGTPPDSTKWGYEVGGGGFGNNELEYYTSRTNNARIEGNQLVIEAKQESFGGRNYTSARLLTKGKWAWTYGRIEARIQIPRGQGLWPAFWMLGTNIDAVSWPTCGEIDIMENIGAEPGTVHGTIHGPGYSGGNGIGGPYTLPGGAAFADAFHIFAIEWETNRIRWYVDGQQYFTVTPANLPSGTTWVFTAPQFLLLNVAVGGNWPGSPNASTTFPQRMTVDYVRVYAATNAAPITTNDAACGGNVLPNPGFELAGLSTWTTYGGNTYLQSSASYPVHSGSNVFKVYGQFIGSQNDSGLFRDTPTTPGTSYTADGWALTQASDKIAVGNSAWLEVTFRDAGLNILGLYRSALVTNSSAAGAWLKLQVTNQFAASNNTFIGTVTNLVAPAGATVVRCQVLFRQPQNAAGSVLFDDLNLYLPGPSDLPVAATAVNNGNAVSIGFPTLSGIPYQVRYKNALTDPNWQVLTNVTGTGAVKIISDALLPGQRFYRVSRLCN